MWLTKLQCTNKKEQFKSKALQCSGHHCLHQSVMTAHRCVKQDFGVCLSIPLGNVGIHTNYFTRLANSQWLFVS